MIITFQVAQLLCLSEYIMLDCGWICTPYVPSRGQLAEILTKGLQFRLWNNICKLGMENNYSPAWGGVLEIRAFFIITF